MVLRIIPYWVDLGDRTTLRRLLPETHSLRMSRSLGDCYRGNDTSRLCRSNTMARKALRRGYVLRICKSWLHGGKVRLILSFGKAYLDNIELRYII